MESFSFLSKEEVLIKKLLDFYSDPKNISVFTNIVEQGTVISLRLLDWFSTNYSKYNRIYVNDIDIHSDYKDQLKGYKKAYFDPFCRRERIFLKCKNRNIRKPDGKLDLECISIVEQEKYLGREDGIVTTVGQLNFFRWCLEKNVIGYIINNLKEIEKSMLQVSCKKKKKSSEEQQTKNNNVYKTIMQVTVKFN